jgi:antitoxin (DNA-binding transcriptional repressor) of toxin-antitoxin stability system
MDAVQTISRADLPREAQRVLDAVHEGHPAIIEHGGEPEAAIVDIVDYRLLRALARLRTSPIAVENPEMGLSGRVADQAPDIQARFDLIVAYYLAEAIGLGRTAELLGMAWVELRDRFVRWEYACGRDEPRSRSCARRSQWRSPVMQCVVSE